MNRLNKIKDVNKKRFQSLKLILLTLVLLFSNLSLSQLSQNNIERYTIGEIEVSGNTSFSPITIVTFSGLREGDAISIPGEKLSNAIKKLWGSNLFSSVDVYKTNIENGVIDLEIELYDLPELTDLQITGVKKRKIEEIIKENKLQTGVKVTENLITTTKNYLENKYRKKGFLNAKVIIKTEEVIDSSKKSKVKMSLDIKKGNKIKINKIQFEGISELKSKTLEKAMKNTKKRKFYRIFKRSKYVPDDFKEDLASLVDKYKENGFRDARVVSDTILNNDDQQIDVSISLIEGSKYTFGKIEYLGNSVYTDQQLNQILKIKEGDTYNGVEL